jgi:hypothetical protein
MPGDHRERSGACQRPLVITRVITKVITSDITGRNLLSCGDGDATSTRKRTEAPPQGLCSRRSRCIGRETGSPAAGSVCTRRGAAVYVEAAMPARARSTRTGPTARAFHTIARNVAGTNAGSRGHSALVRVDACVTPPSNSNIAWERTAEMQSTSYSTDRNIRGIRRAAGGPLKPRCPGGGRRSRIRARIPLRREVVRSRYFRPPTGSPRSSY